MRLRHGLAVLSTSIVIGACAADDTGANRRDTMTQRQRDSVLARSGLPGAGGVGKALNAADSAKARQAQMDSLARP